MRACECACEVVSTEKQFVFRYPIVNALVTFCLFWSLFCVRVVNLSFRVCAFACIGMCVFVISVCVCVCVCLFVCLFVWLIGCFFCAYVRVLACSCSTAASRLFVCSFGQI